MNLSSIYVPCKLTTHFYTLKDFELIFFFLFSIFSIPIAWDSQEVAYFVGLSCDLVEQPAAILDKMKDGSYVVNYSYAVSYFRLLPFE